MKRFVKTFIDVSLRGIRSFIGPQGYCRFTPSCREFALEQLTTRSAWSALWHIVKRLVRCSPFFTYPD